MSDIPHAHIRRRMAKRALTIARGGGSDSEKLRAIAAAFQPDADELVVIGMEQTILAAARRKKEIAAGVKERAP